MASKVKTIAKKILKAPIKLVKNAIAGEKKFNRTVAQKNMTELKKSQGLYKGR